ncbi:A24 family peptidase [Catenulispora subtropica]|uniref:Prepilin type IV endopeptidase peptidase domain-containing protein n=1 Tax=Catenulispora subtropica TaxID=450798 RepID=A0ABP5EPW7_9ACTN
MTLHCQPLALVSGVAVGAAAGVLAVRAARSTASQSDNDAVRRVNTQSAEWGILIAGPAAGAAIGVRFGVGIELAAYLSLVAVALPLSAIDIAVRKVPDRILIPALPAAVALLALSAHCEGTYSALGRALLAGCATFAAYLALALGTGQLGLGDCKAAGFCGIFLGYVGWRTTAFGALLAFVLAAAVAVLRMARRGSARDKTLAFAPYIFAGALVAVAIS